MTPIARLAGVVFPGCAREGADGVPMPPADLTRLDRPSRPNTALAAPPGFLPAAGPKPDLVTPPYPLSPAALIARLRAVAAAMPRTYALGNTAADAGRADWVVRSALMNYPDVVSAQALADDQGTGSRLILYSRSIYGHSDLGVNLKRARAWLAALAA